MKWPCPQCGRERHVTTEVAAEGLLTFLSCPECNRDKTVEVMKETETLALPATCETIKWLLDRIPKHEGAQQAARGALFSYHAQAMKAARLGLGGRGKEALVQKLRDQLAEKLRELLDVYPPDPKGEGGGA